MVAGHLGGREHCTAGELAAVYGRRGQSDQIAAVPVESSGSAQLDQMASGDLGVRGHSTVVELAEVDGRLAQSDQIAAVPLNSSELGRVELTERVQISVVAQTNEGEPAPFYDRLSASGRNRAFISVITVSLKNKRKETR